MGRYKPSKFISGKVARSAFVMLLLYLLRSKEPCYAKSKRWDYVEISIDNKRHYLLTSKLWEGDRVPIFRQERIEAYLGRKGFEELSSIPNVVPKPAWLQFDSCG